MSVHEDDDDERIVIRCVPWKSGTQWTLPTSERRRCQECQHEIWVDTSLIVALKRTHPKRPVYLMCLACSYQLGESNAMCVEQIHVLRAAGISDSEIIGALAFSELVGDSIESANDAMEEIAANPNGSLARAYGQAFSRAAMLVGLTRRPFQN